jgi:hypothetical protein
VQLGTALVHGAQGFITYDRTLARVREIDVLQLDDFLR